MFTLLYMPFYLSHLNINVLENSKHTLFKSATFVHVECNCLTEADVQARDEGVDEEEQDDETQHQPTFHQQHGVRDPVL